MIWTPPKVIRNAAQCLVCNDTIESSWGPGHFVTCKCGALSLDGGRDFYSMRRLGGEQGFEDLRVFDPPKEEWGDPT